MNSKIIKNPDGNQSQLVHMRTSVLSVMMVITICIAPVSIVLVGWSLSSQNATIDRLNSDLDTAIDRAINSEEELLDKIRFFEAEKIELTTQRDTALERVRLLETEQAALTTQRDGERHRADSFALERDTYRDLANQRQREVEIQQQQMNLLRDELYRAHAAGRVFNYEKRRIEKCEIEMEEMAVRNQQQMDFLQQQFKRMSVERLGEKTRNTALEGQRQRLREEVKALKAERDTLTTGPQHHMGIVDGRLNALRAENEYLRVQMLLQGDDDVTQGLTTSNIARTQDGPNCWKFAAATWIRGLKRTWLLGTQIPAHDKIVESFKTQQEEKFTREFVMSMITPGARKHGFEVRELFHSTGKDPRQFDSVKRELDRGYPVIFQPTPEHWRMAKMYIQMLSKDLVEEPVLNLKVWREKYPQRHECDEDRKHITHMMVIAKFIPGTQETGGMGIYIIKNSHGEHGGSPGCNGFIRIDQRVFEQELDVELWAAHHIEADQ